jgi:hypothetical protein
MIQLLFRSERGVSYHLSSYDHTHCSTENETSHPALYFTLHATLMAASNTFLGDPSSNKHLSEVIGNQEAAWSRPRNRQEVIFAGLMAPGRKRGVFFVEKALLRCHEWAVVLQKGSMP